MLAFSSRPHFLKKIGSSVRAIRTPQASYAASEVSPACAKLLERKFPADQDIPAATEDAGFDLGSPKKTRVPFFSGTRQKYRPGDMGTSLN